MSEEKKDDIQEEVVAETLDGGQDEVGTEEAQSPQADDDRSAQLEAGIAELEKENAELKDRLVRNVADTENYKKRLAREKEEAVKSANTALVKDLIGPLDDFSRALDAAEQSSNFDALKEGVRMIEDKLYSTLKTNWGLEVIDQKDVPFDPNEREACMMEELEGASEDMVTMLLQKGYKLNGRVIRPAKVKVGKAKG